MPNKKLSLKESKKKYIFLAGSMDSSKNNWRNKLMNSFDNYSFFDPTNKNHNRLNVVEMKNHVFRELNALEKADIIFLNLLPNSLSPISLVELGLYVKSKKLTVICPKEFYKSSYVYTLCEKYNTPIFTKIEDALNELKN